MQLVKLYDYDAAGEGEGGGGIVLPPPGGCEEAVASLQITCKKNLQYLRKT